MTQSESESELEPELESVVDELSSSDEAPSGTAASTAAGAAASCTTANDGAGLGLALGTPPNISIAHGTSSDSTCLCGLCIVQVIVIHQIAKVWGWRQTKQLRLQQWIREHRYLPWMDKGMVALAIVKA
mmetsp:Transcript_81935/g.264507  ORF Transcript_81935/g.264507 Transcript_81935/m.264507 type:complete len:129 (-) Transcript_81935:1665-2051(-)